MSKVVIFTEDNARVIYTETPQDWAQTPNVLIDPDLKEVTGVAPHFWKISGSEVVPMNDEERAARADYHKHTTTRNKIPDPIKPVAAEVKILKEVVYITVPEPKSYNNHLLVTFVAIAVVLAIKHWMFK